MMPRINEVGDSNFSTFDANCPELSVARTHHLVAEADSTQWIDQTNDVYLGSNSPFEEEGFHYTDTAIVHAYSYPDETYPSLM
jgi:hypothetical protein